ncbi:hypothetical protein PR048_019429 [Dryococelus australis]|uniref:Uncharacterized protein n=1 Tax=Dryococelus australis TaxID=614101 RepID=A0ABQ9H3I7_9NEOP|nr:hypothetical protein PR048_019429 [Dryococelus australis]
MERFNVTSGLKGALRRIGTIVYNEADMTTRRPLECRSDGLMHNRFDYELWGFFTRNDMLPESQLLRHFLNTCASSRKITLFSTARYRIGIRFVETLSTVLRWPPDVGPIILTDLKLSHTVRRTTFQHIDFHVVRYLRRRRHYVGASIHGRVTSELRMGESCRTMPLVGGFSRGSPVSPTLPFRRFSMLTSIARIGSRDLAVNSCSFLFTHSLFCAISSGSLGMSPTYNMASGVSNLQLQCSIVSCFTSALKAGGNGTSWLLWAANCWKAGNTHSTCINHGSCLEWVGPLAKRAVTPEAVATAAMFDAKFTSPHQMLSDTFENAVIVPNNPYNCNDAGDEVLFAFHCGLCTRLRIPENRTPPGLSIVEGIRDSGDRAHVANCGLGRRRAGTTWLLVFVMEPLRVMSAELPAEMQRTHCGLDDMISGYVLRCSRNHAAKSRVEDNLQDPRHENFVCTWNGFSNCSWSTRQMVRWHLFSTLVIVRVLTRGLFSTYLNTSSSNPAVLAVRLALHSVVSPPTSTFPQTSLHRCKCGVVWLLSVWKSIPVHYSRFSSIFLCRTVEE